MKLRITVDNKPESLDITKNLINSLNFDQETKNRIKIIITEILENLQHHSDPEKVVISIREYKSKKISILIMFKSRNFEIIIQKIENTKVYFSHPDKRYRGLGVRMYHNLSSLVIYKYNDGWINIFILL